MRHTISFVLAFALLVLFTAGFVEAQQVTPVRILIHMKTSLALDDAQICAVPNVAWAAVKAGHKVTILVDASAVPSVTKGFGWFNGIFRPDSTALDQGLKVNVLVDADGINTYKVGWFDKDSIQDYKVPEQMREVLAKQFNVPIEKVPRVYGEYLEMLRGKGAAFFINQEMLVTAGLGTADNPLDQISVKWFKPVTMPELIGLRTAADFYMAY